MSSVIMSLRQYKMILVLAVVSAVSLSIVCVPEARSLVLSPDRKLSAADLRHLINEHRYSEALAAKASLSSRSLENAEINYLLGVAAFERYQLDRAKEYFVRASQGKVKKTKVCAKATASLDKVEKLISLLPPVVGTSPDSHRNRIIVRSDCDSKSNEVLLKSANVLSKWADLIFPNSASTIEIIIWKEPPLYQSFFYARAGENPFRWQSAAAQYGMVIASSAGVNHLGHEYGHALCRAFYGDCYSEDVPNWLDEALANQFRGKLDNYQPEANYLKRISGEQQKPLWSKFVSGFYAQPELNYAIAALIGNEIFSDASKEVSYIPIILRLIRHGLGTDEAVELVSGESPERIFDRVISRFWKS